MATYLINSALQTQEGTPSNDIFVVESGAQKVTLYGNAADDQFRLLLGANNSSYNFGNSVMNGQLGNDVFLATLHTGIDWVGNFFGGGQGNDILLFTAEEGSSADFVGNTIQGGLGNDTLKFAGAEMGVDGLTMNGNEGADYVVFSASASGAAILDQGNIFLAGGKGNDQVIFDLGSTGGENFSIAGGADEDRIRVEFDDTAHDVIINGGTFGEINSQSDGGDDIWLSAEEIKSATIFGNDGDDSISLNVYYTAENVLMHGGRGNDTLLVSAHTDSLTDFTVDGAAGNDLIIMRGSAGLFSQTGAGGSLIGGSGDDTIIFNETGYDSFTSFYANNVTIEGGAGADLFMVVTSNGSNVATASTSRSISGGLFSYASLSDSTIDSLDTIMVGTSGGSGIFELFMPVAVNAFDGVAGGYKFTAGMLEFDTGAASGGGSGNPIRLSQIVGVLDATLETGDAVAFRLQTGDGQNPSALAGYVFVKGKGDDDLLVEFGQIDTAMFTAGDSFLRNNGSQVLTLKAGG